MDEAESCEAYWKAVRILTDVIDSGFRGTKQDIIEELEDDLCNTRMH